MRRRVPALAALSLAAAGIAATAVLGEDGGNPGTSGTRGGGGTVAVTRQNLVQRETVEGTLGYAGRRTVLHRLATSGGSGGGATGGGAASTTPETADSASPATAAASPATASASMAIATTAPAAYFADEDSSAGDPPPADADPPGESEGGDSDGSAGEDPSGDPSGEDPSGDDPSGDDSSGEDAPGDSPSGGAPSGGSPSGGSPSGSAPSGASPSAGGSGAASQSRGSAPGGSGSGSPSGSSSSDSANGSGTVTALPRPGSVVRRGGALYRVDGKPVVLMYGAVPAYRDLSQGVEDGRDVLQLERNLAALGHDPGEVDETFTSTTAAAVSDWQESAGLTETGTVELGRVVFLPGARRVGEHRTSVGGVLAAGSEVLDTSSTRRVVTVELDAALQSLARVGDRVEVLLPNQSTVRGRITDVGRVAREQEDSSAAAGDPAAGSEQELVIDVSVTLRTARGLGRLDEAPVSVGLAQESRKDVLAVPVDALVARKGGGYGVELAAGRRIVPVQTGLFAGGYVEVSGAGIREGTRVVVPDA